MIRFLGWEENREKAGKKRLPFPAAFFVA